MADLNQPKSKRKRIKKCLRCLCFCCLCFPCCDEDTGDSSDLPPKRAGETVQDGVPLSQLETDANRTIHAARVASRLSDEKLQDGSLAWYDEDEPRPPVPQVRPPPGVCPKGESLDSFMMKNGIAAPPDDRENGASEAEDDEDSAGAHQNAMPADDEAAAPPVGGAPQAAEAARRAKNAVRVGESLDEILRQLETGEAPSSKIKKIELRMEEPLEEILKKLKTAGEAPKVKIQKIEIHTENYPRREPDSAGQQQQQPLPSVEPGPGSAEPEEPETDSSDAEQKRSSSDQNENRSSSESDGPHSDEQGREESASSESQHPRLKRSASDHQLPQVSGKKDLWKCASLEPGKFGLENARERLAARPENPAPKSPKKAVKPSAAAEPEASRPENPAPEDPASRDRGNPRPVEPEDPDGARKEPEDPEGIRKEPEDPRKEPEEPDPAVPGALGLDPDNKDAQDDEKKKKPGVAARLSNSLAKLLRGKGPAKAE